MYLPPFSRRAFLAKALMTPLLLGSGRLLAQSDAASDATLVKTPSGPLRGTTVAGIRTFRGVPFAEPPVGDGRFRPPGRVKPWTAERDATHSAPAAMQPGGAKNSFSEDCLYLNLWAPEGKGPFPVYVWIHGGGYTGGSASDPGTNGAEFARNGIICITVAYRLGVFGFLDMAPLLGPSYAGSANNGLRDVMAALAWTQDNIHAFGGDPSRVTIGGESAGAKLTDTLMGIPSAQPLFHQMISESGGAERIWQPADATATAAGFGDDWQASSGLPLADLQTAPAEELIAAQERFDGHWPKHFPLRPEISSPFMPRLPVQSIAGGLSRGKRLLIGTNRDESALFIGPHPTHDPTAADLGNLPVDRFAPILAEYEKLYPQMTDEQRRIRALTAEEYWVPSVRVADAHCRGGGRAWMYRLDFTETSGRLMDEAYHSLDVGLAWNDPHRNVENAAAEAALSTQVHQAWVAFIQGASPSAPGLPTWPEYRPGPRATMVLDVQSHVDQKPQEAELRLWDAVL